MERAPEACDEASEPSGQSCTNEKRLDFKHTSKATSSRFADENDGVANGRRRVEGDSRIFGLHSWKGRN